MERERGELMTYSCPVYSCPWRYRPDGLVHCSFHKPKPRPIWPYWRVFDVRDGYLTTPSMFTLGVDGVHGRERSELPAPPWRPGEWVTASCLRGHEAPAAECSCGVYAVPKRGDLTSWLAGMTRQTVTSGAATWEQSVQLFAMRLALADLNMSNALVLHGCAIAPVELDNPIRPVPPGKEPPDPPGTARGARGRVPVDATVWVGKLARLAPGVYRTRPMGEVLRIR